VLFQLVQKVAAAYNKKVFGIYQDLYPGIDSDPEWTDLAPQVDAYYKSYGNSIYKIETTWDKFHFQNPKFSIVPTMVGDSMTARKEYLQSGCNDFENGISMPIGFWRPEDIEEYIKQFSPIVYVPRASSGQYD
jgi:hypothetical protein